MSTDNATHSREDRADRRMEGKRAFNCPGLANATVATGHAMLGLSLGPVTGKLVSDLITQGKPELEVELPRLAPQRFG